MSGRHRAVAIACLVAALAVPPGGSAAAHRALSVPPARTGSVVLTPGVAAQAAATAPHVPVILVPGITSDADVWSSGANGGLLQDFVQHGYRPGLDLIRYAPAEPGAAPRVAAQEVQRLAVRAMAGTGRRQVDLVAHGSGALTARYLVDFVAPPGEVRSVVMIAPPNHGSFAANAVRVALAERSLDGFMAERLSAAMAKAILQAQPDFPAALDAAADLADEQPLPDGAEWADVKALVTQVWLPLMAWFVVHERLLPEGERDAGQPLPQETFAQWLQAEAPDFMPIVLGEGSSPPAGVSSGDGDGALHTWRRAGEPVSAGLSPAYTCLLAYTVAAQASALARGLADARPALPSTQDVGAFTGGMVGAGLRGAVVAGVLSWLGSWGQRAAQTLLRPAVHAAGSWAAATAASHLWGLHADSPMLARLVTVKMGIPWQPDEDPGEDAETLYVPTPDGADRDPGRSGGSADGHETPPAIVANRFLAAWDALEKRQAPRRATRYTVISARTVNLWQWIWPRVTANDGFVQAGSAALVPGPLDTRATVSGWWSATHNAVVGSRAVRTAVFANLDPFANAKRLAVGGDHTYEVRVWTPLVLTVPVDGTLTLRADIPSGSHLQAEWLAPGGRTARPLAGAGEGQGWTGRVPAGYLTLRLTEDGPATAWRDRVGRVVVGLRATSGSQAGTPWTASQHASEPAASNAAPGSEDDARAGGGGVARAGGGDAAFSGTDADAPAGSGKRAPQGGATGASTDSGVAAGADGPPGVPPSGSEARPDSERLVRVVRHSKLTTTKKPHVIRHVRWEWDFGDGQRKVDKDPDHVASHETHTFAEPGTYTVKARAIGTDGRLLHQRNWRVTTQKAGQTKAFSAVSIVPPDPTLVLDGPRDWVAGRPAAFKFSWKYGRPANVAWIKERAYPGTAFQVLWEKPGDTFEVRAALSLEVRYEFPDGDAFIAWDTYLAKRTLDVYATSVTN